jgi:hypothetical protein
MSVHGWKAMLELGRQETKSKLEDDDGVETIMEYLMEKAPKSCYETSNTEMSYTVQLPFLFG